MMEEAQGGLAVWVGAGGQDVAATPCSHRASSLFQ